MRNHFFWIVIFYLFPVICFAQAFDNLPYSNPDRWTFFQQEMKSHMRFQAENDIDVILFMGASVRFFRLKYQEDYLEQLYGRSVSENRLRGNEDVNYLFGFQARLSNSLYMPLIWHYGNGKSYSLLEEYEYEYFGFNRKGPVYIEESVGGSFFATGLVLDTDIIKNGFYLGWATFEKDYTKMEYNISNPDIAAPRSGFRAAIVPLVNTYGLSYVGKVLNNVLGYIGIGDPVKSFAHTVDNYIINDFANSLNTSLDFTFNKINFNFLTLEPQLMYTRGSYDVVAKNDVYGLKLQGLFSNSGFGFTLEGGYKHFFSVAKLFSSDYNDTGYFNGSIFYRVKWATSGIIYYYDNIVSRLSFVISFAVSAPPLLSILDSAFFWSFNKIERDYDREKMDLGAFFDLGIRFRYGW
jgi:hypothetical protein